MKEEKLKELIRKQVREALNEISQTGNVAGYQTPYAFTGKSDDAKESKKDWMKKINKQYGYTMVNEATPEALQDFYAYFRDMDTEDWEGSRNDETDVTKPPVNEAYMGDPEVGDIVKVMGSDYFGEITHTDSTHGDRFWVSYHDEPGNRGKFFNPRDLKVLYDSRHNEWTDAARSEHKRAYPNK